LDWVFLSAVLFSVLLWTHAQHIHHIAIAGRSTALTARRT